VELRWAAIAAATLAVSGCSSGPPDYVPAPGTLRAGTAQLTVNGQNLGALTTIRTGDQASGITALISNKAELTTEAVDINDVGGFTGSYNAGLGGTATVTMTGRTYHIAGSAEGFATANPSFRTSGTFAIKVSC
jgi:hypothetical protein